jgi:hypothetical protein
MKKAHRKYAFRGLLSGVLILLIGEICLIFFLAYQFEGKCGGLMPFLSGPRNCSLIEFLVTDGFSITLFFVVFNSPWILLFLSLATLIGYGLGRLKTKNIKSNSEPSQK